MRKAIGFVAGSVFGLALVATCGTRQTKGGDGLLADAGHLIGDAGQAIGDLLGVDLGVSDAAASAPMSAACDKTWSYTVGNNATTTHYAEFQVPGFDPTNPEHVTAFVCGPPVGQLVTLFGCGAGVTCDAPVPGDCQGASVHSASNGVIRVYCGFSSAGSGAPYDYAWKTAYLKVGL